MYIHFITISLLLLVGLFVVMVSAGFIVTKHTTDSQSDNLLVHATIRTVNSFGDFMHKGSKTFFREQVHHTTDA